MHTSVYDLIPQGLVCVLRQFVIDEGVGGHLHAPVTARPILGCSQQPLADSALPAVLGDVPSFDVSNWLCWIAAVRMRTKINLQEPDESPITGFGYEDGEGHG